MMILLIMYSKLRGASRASERASPGFILARDVESACDVRIYERRTRAHSRLVYFSSSFFLSLSICMGIGRDTVEV